MGKLLSDDQVAQYRRDGIHFPVVVMTADEAARIAPQQITTVAAMDMKSLSKTAPVRIPTSVLVKEA